MGFSPDPLNQPLGRPGVSSIWLTALRGFDAHSSLRSVAPPDGSTWMPISIWHLTRPPPSSGYFLWGATVWMLPIWVKGDSNLSFAQTKKTPCSQSGFACLTHMSGLSKSSWLCIHTAPRICPPLSPPSLLLSWSEPPSPATRPLQKPLGAPLLLPVTPSLGTTQPLEGSL